MKSLFQKIIIMGLACLLVACGGGSGSSRPAFSSASSSVSSHSVSSEAPDALLSGSISFDYIPHNANNIGLDYENIQSKPSRGIRVELLDESENLLSTQQTDREGHFEFQVTQNQKVKIRVIAQLQSSTSPSWDISVKDNTRQNLPYAIEGQLKPVESSNEIRNLHAASGWNGSTYAASRSAAPFAILDTIYTGIDQLKIAGLTQNLPPLSIFWSEKNTTAEGDPTQGEIGTSYFSQDAIYLLGDADVDTDEYDAHVILHEWTHYLEVFLARTDSIGDRHDVLEKLDMRLAFSEGFANAFSGMMLDDVIYKDALGISQRNGFSINLANKSQSLRGWYSQASITTIFYNYYLSSLNRNEKSISDIWAVLISDDYDNNPYFTTIFSFSELLQRQAPDAFSTWTALLIEQNINSVAASAEGESNAGGYAENLPIYKSLSVGNPSANLCSSNRFGSVNHLSNYQFARVSIQQSGNYQLNVTNLNQNTAANPDIYFYLHGTLIASVSTTKPNEETMQSFLLAGDYIVAVADAAVINAIGNQDITHCFQLNLNMEQGA